MNKIYNILLKIMKKNRTAYKYLIKKICRMEGGEHVSETIRAYAEKNKVYVGLYTYGSCFSDSFNLGGEVIVGRYCSIAENVRYFGANHPIEYASTSALFYNKQFGLNVKDVERHRLIIGNDVWIGANAIITSACSSIGNGAIIGAGAIVTKDVKPYSIVCGNPAHIIRMRFPADIIDALEESQWWEYKPEQLYEFYEYIDNPKEWAMNIYFMRQNANKISNQS